MPDSDPDLLDSLLGRMQEETSGRLEQQMQEAKEIKQQEELASERRLEDMWIREHERQRAIAAEQAEQRRQEQMLIRYALIGAAIVILIIVILALILGRSSGEATSRGLPILLTAYA
jgi:hypothetical protein